MSLQLAKVFIPNAVRNSRLLQTVRHAILPNNHIYDREYYERDVDIPATESSNVMACSILARFPARSVIDVGCGTGALLQAFSNLGCDARGLEYSNAGIAFCERRGLSVRKFNIERDAVSAVDRYDIATSFEVAEHLPTWSADRYVKLLCVLAPRVIMSAATPGQGGTDHINEQPHSYWIKKFEDNGYSFDGRGSEYFASEWETGKVASFYFKNVMTFAAR
jgi:cyclopropane fatty-acyl-phospholipid synthase-like methyltransferase